MQAVAFVQDGKTVSREHVLAMEVRRARHMMSLFMRKLGSEGMAKLFHEEMAEMSKREHEWVGASHGKWVGSVVHGRVQQGSGAEFAQWFLAGYMGSNAPAMMRAHPEHLGVLPFADGRVGILEVPGHTDLPAVLHLRPLQTWPQDVAIELDPTMPVRIMGQFETKEGEACGYLLHQFRDTNPGFEMQLAVYWPANVPKELVEGHADHLVLEFTNWLQAYVETREQPKDLMPRALTVNT